MEELMMPSCATIPTSQESSVSPRRKPEIPLPPHIQRVKAKGRTYLYLTKGRGTDGASRPIRLPDDVGSADFWAAYHAGLGKPALRFSPNRMSQLIAAYTASPEWEELSEGTRKNWRLHLRRTEAAWGGLDVRGIRPVHVIALRDAYKATPAAANNLLRCLSSMLAWSVPREWRDDNPVLRVGKLQGGEGYEPWPWEMIELVRDRGPRWAWHATAVAVFSGQREGDCLSMPWSKIRDGAMKVRQQKTKCELLIPVHRDLAAVLYDIPRLSTHILTSSKGTPWTKDGFRSSWAKAIHGTEVNPSPLKPIADAGLVFHGLRKSAVCTMLEAGCTEAEVMSVTGQSAKMVAHYAKQVNQQKLAASAILKWERAVNA